MAARLAEVGDVVARTHAQLDISAWPAVSAVMSDVRPDVVINCAAYNNVDEAEREPLAALAANAWGPRHLARAAGEVGTTLVHFSTDFVFDGETTQPYTEEDRPNPQGRYAISKLVGEWFVAEAPDAYVLRVESLFGGPRAKSSVDLLLNAILSGGEARPFSDRVVSPSFVEDVVAATLRLIERRPPAGLYHCVNSGLGTWLDLTEELARLAGRPEARIAPRLMSEARLVPPRPRFAALSNAKLAAAGIPMPAWQDALARYVQSRRVTEDNGGRGALG